MTTPEGQRSSPEPHDSSQHENLTSRGQRARILRTLGQVGGAVCIGVASFGATMTITNAGVRADIRDWITGPFNPPPSEPVLPQDKWAIEWFDRSLAETLDKHTESFKAWQIFSETELQSLLEKRQPEKVIKMLAQMQKNSLIQSANILQSAWLFGVSEDRVAISPDLNSAWINHRYYDLQNNFHTQLASSWIAAKMYYLQGKLKLSLNRAKEEELGPTYRVMDEFQEAMELFEWLRDRNPNIVLKEDSFAFFRVYEMFNMARVFKALADHGYSLPNRIDWCGTRCLEKYGAQGRAYPLSNRAELDNQASAEVVAHEVAHLIDYSEGFNSRFATVRGITGQGLKEHRFRYISSYAMKNTTEDFAETFAQYLMFGDRFRMLLEEIRLHRPEDYKILQGKYNFIRDEVFKGTEFSSSAKVRDTKEERETNEFTGIHWDPKTRALGISPNPNASPNQRYATITIPVLVEDDFKDIKITFHYLPEENSYKVWFDNHEFISKIIINPIVGDERLTVSFVNPPRPSKSGNKVELNPSEIAYPYTLSFTVDSLPKVELGQRRKSRREAILTPDTSQPDPRSTSLLFDKYNLWIVGGPHEMVDPKSGRVMRFWRVEATKLEEPDKGTMKFGWVNEEGIGKNIIK